jgi:hypothetical protein
MEKGNKKTLEKLLKERKITTKKIGIETNGFVETITSWEATIFMATKLTSQGLFAVFYGEDGIGRNPDEKKPFYVFENHINIEETEELKNKIKKYHYDDYFDLAQELTPENDDGMEKWFSSLNEAKEFAERRYKEVFKDGGSIKIKGAFKPLGTAKELGIIPKIEGHDMIAKCDCGEKFSYQNSKKNIIWECPECKGMKRIKTS